MLFVTLEVQALVGAVGSGVTVLRAGRIHPYGSTHSSHCFPATSPPGRCPRLSATPAGPWDLSAPRFHWPRAALCLGRTVSAASGLAARCDTFRPNCHPRVACQRARLAPQRGPYGRPRRFACAWLGHLCPPPFWRFASPSHRRWLYTRPVLQKNVCVSVAILIHSFGPRFQFLT